MLCTTQVCTKAAGLPTNNAIACITFGATMCAAVVHDRMYLHSVAGCARRAWRWQFCSLRQLSEAAAVTTTVCAVKLSADACNCDTSLCLVGNGELLARDALLVRVPPCNSIPACTAAGRGTKWTDVYVYVFICTYALQQTLQARSFCAAAKEEAIP